MKYREFANELGKAGLNIREFADLIAMNRNSISNYAGKDVPRHLAFIAVLLGELNVRGINFRPILSKVDVPPRRTRGGSGPGKFRGDPQTELDLR